MLDEIKPNQIYTTEETRDFLKISESTIKRLLKKGTLRAYKVGGQYRILGTEILRLVAPHMEDKVYNVYRKIKTKAKKAIAKW